MFTPGSAKLLFTSGIGFWKIPPAAMASWSMSASSRSRICCGVMLRKSVKSASCPLTLSLPGRAVRSSRLFKGTVGPPSSDRVRAARPVEPGRRPG